MRIALCLFLCFVITTPLMAQQSLTPQAQRDINISRKLINDKRNQTLAFNMSFTQAEKEEFWPLYREYRTSMGVVGDKRLAVIVDYADHIGKMTEEKARQLLNDSLSVEKERLKVKQKYIRKFRRILPEIKIVRLMQIESRIDAMVELRIAEGVPLME
jgi:polyhydroxyalkanoate synthesis regulator phasin